jgi:hypothetical protein
MELSAKEVNKISKKFKVPEIDILNFLAEEERLIQLSNSKKLCLEATINPQKKLLKQWQENCKNYSEFEDLYVNIKREQLSDQFFFDWMSSTKDYREKREIHSCVINEVELAKKIAIFWIENATALVDIREAMSHVGKDSAEYKLGLKKVINDYRK